jgi:HAD superfamily hydrolase (TIGR01509 family)
MGDGTTMKKLEAKALLIDLDGTIVDSMEVFEAATEAAFSAVGHKSSSGKLGLEIARCLQLNRSLDELFEQNHVNEALREKFLSVFLQSFYTIAASRTKLLPDVENTLHVLSRDFSLALITRRHVSKTQVVKELERLHVSSLFGAVVTSLEVAKPSPSPDALLKAADELQVPIDSCIVVSDSGVDIQAGKCAGAKTVAVLSGLFEKEELVKENPDLIIDEVRRLPEHLVAT